MTKLNQYSNLTQRVVAAVVGAIILINAIYWSEWSFTFIFGIILMLSQWEFYTLLKKANKNPLRIFGVIMGGSIFLGMFCLLKFNQLHLLPFGILCVFVIFLGAFLQRLYDTKHTHEPFADVAYTFLGIFYVALPFVALLILAFVGSFQINLENNQTIFPNRYSFQIVMGILLMLWGNDTGAYFAGKAFGKTKLFERISPKKTWEGFFGGMLVDILLASVFSLYFKDLSTFQWCGIAVLMPVFGTYGDLIESMLKRNLQIKDSGSVIPGHGGFLDRFDGLLVAVPVILVFVKLTTSF
jgi:phosphatidate cytidylyltransferase